MQSIILTIDMLNCKLELLFHNDIIDIYILILYSREQKQKSFATYEGNHLSYFQNGYFFRILWFMTYKIREYACKKINNF